MTNDGSGNLSGYGWSENAGWINFAPTGAAGANAAKINITTRKFSGYVWAENVGWVALAGTAVNATPYFVETTWPPTVNSWTYTSSNRQLVLNFNESMVDSQTTATSFAIATSAAGANAFSLTGGTVTGGTAATLIITLNAADADRINTWQADGTAVPGTPGGIYLSWAAGASQDKYANNMPARAATSGLQCATWAGDVVPPVINSTTYNASNKRVTFVFSHIININSFTAANLAKLSIQNGTTTVTLSGATIISTADSATMVARLTPAEDAALYAIRTQPPTLKVVVGASSGIRDLAATELATNTNYATSTYTVTYQADVTAPVISSATYAQASRKLTITFDEYIDVSTFTAANLAKLSIQDQLANTVTLSGATIITVASSTIMEATLTVAEDNSLFAIKDNTLRLVVGAASGIKDLSLNELAQNTYATPAASVTYTTAAATPITGTLMDSKSGLIIANAVVQLYDSAGNLRGETTSDNKGNFSFNVNIPSGDYTLNITKPPMFKNKTQTISVTAGTALATGDVLIDPFGIVYDAVTGNVIQGANVTIYTAGGLIYGGSPQPNPQSSRANGGYNFDVAPGTYYLTAAKDGYANYRGATFQVINQIVEWNIPMVPGGSEAGSYLSIMHSVNKTTASVGDILTYTITVTNTSSTVDVTSANVSAGLPHDFRYAKGTTTIDKASGPDPSSAKSPSWPLGTITHATTRTITYRVIIGPDVKTGKNKAYASVAGTALGSSTQAGPSTAVVDIRDGLFCKKELVIGKVFNDKNGDGIQDKGEEGIPGVALIMEDGKTIVTDEDGKFSVPDVAVGVHIFRVDQRMLPGGPLTKESTLNKGEKTAYEATKIRQLQSVQYTAGGSGQSPLPSLRGSEAAEAISKSGIVSLPLAALGVARNDTSNLTNTTNGQSSAGQSLFSQKPAALSDTGAQQSYSATNPIDANNPANNNYTPLIERRTLGDWSRDSLFGKEKPVKEEEDPRAPKKQALAYRPDIPRVSKFFRVYETQSTKVNIPLKLLSEEETKAQVSADSKENQFMLVALADGQLGYMVASGNLQNLKDTNPKEGLTDNFNNSITANGTLKAYLKGKIQGKYLLTARFDSTKDYQDHLFEYINPEKYYPIYGDKSTLLNDADSPEKVYVRLDRADSYALYGNYSTEEFAKTELSKYARTLSGAKGHIETKDFSSPREIAAQPNVKLDVFGTETRQEKREDTLSGRGVSGPYFLSRKPVIEYTEIIRMEVRDKSRTDLVLSTQGMQRDTDYDIDYDYGRILFKKPIPTYNENNDPVYIVVDYEYTPLVKLMQHYIMGTRGEVVFDKRALANLIQNFKVGGQFIAEQKDMQSLRLGGVDATSEIFPGTTVSGEYARSDNLLTKPGNAWRLEAESKLFNNRLEFQGYATEIDPNFSNPINVSETAVQKYDVSVKFMPIENVSFILDQWKRRSITTHTFDRATKIDAYYTKGRYILGTGYEFREFEDEKDLTPRQTSNILRLQAGAKLTDKLITSMEYRFDKQNTEGQWRKQIETLSPRIDYLIDKTTSAYVRSDLARERTKGEEIVNNQNTTVVGLMRPSSEGGRNYIEYGFTGEKVATLNIGNDLDIPLTDVLSLSSYNSNVLSKDKNEENIGYGARWQIWDDFFTNLAFERTKTTGGMNYNSNATSVTVEYKPAGTDNTIGAKFEKRYQVDVNEFNIDANARYAINRSLYLISRGQFQEERDKTATQTNRLLHRIMGGIAYRPIDNDKLNMLAKYDYSRDLNNSAANDLTDYSKNIGQIEAVYDLTPKVELYGRYALKFVGENILAMNTYSLTDLITARTKYRFTDLFDVAGIYHVTSNRDINTVKQGIQAECGVTLYDRIRVALGYNFSAYDDNDLRGENYTAQGPYVNMTLAVLDPDLADIPGFKHLSQDRIDVLKERMIAEQIKDLPKDEKERLNEKFKKAEALYKEGALEEAKAVYGEIDLRMTRMRFDIDNALKTKLEKEKDLAGKFEEAEAFYADCDYAQARELYEEICKK
ncbi:MAG: carboxypeptidase regulatory-like domain-containing protein [Candidatus Omnitrophota bacterium]|nr:carboxypeptidase regulatory-like domain-containing protein [Candidatus Omnitrophota bacterium]